jgi:hypothetical protein
MEMGNSESVDDRLPTTFGEDLHVDLVGACRQINGGNPHGDYGVPLPDGSELRREVDLCGNNSLPVDQKEIAAFGGYLFPRDDFKGDFQGTSGTGGKKSIRGTDLKALDAVVKFRSRSHHTLLGSRLMVFIQPLLFIAKEGRSTLFQIEYPVADPRDMPQIMGDKENGAITRNLSNSLKALGAEGTIADSQNLVQNQNVGLHGGGHGEAKTHVHSGAVGLDGGINEFPDLSELDDVINPIVDFLFGESEQRTVHVDILSPRQDRIKSGAERDNGAYPPPGLDKSGIRFDQAVQHPEQGCFSGSISPDQAEAFTPPDFKGNALIGPEFPGAKNDLPIGIGFSPTGKGHQLMDCIPDPVHQGFPEIPAKDLSHIMDSDKDIVLPMNYGVIRIVHSGIGDYWEKESKDVGFSKGGDGRTHDL